MNLRFAHDWNCTPTRAYKVVHLWAALVREGVDQQILRGLLSGYGYESRKSLTDAEADEFINTLTVLFNRRAQSSRAPFYLSETLDNLSSRPVNRQTV